MTHTPDPGPCVGPLPEAQSETEKMDGPWLGKATRMATSFPKAVETERATPPAREEGAPVAWRGRRDAEHAWRTTHSEAIADKWRGEGDEIEDLYVRPSPDALLAARGALLVAEQAIHRHMREDLKRDGFSGFQLDNLIATHPDVVTISHALAALDAAIKEAGER